MTNGDALQEFVGEHGRKFAVGETLLLPGGQQYKLVRFTARKTDKRLFLKFGAKCLLCSEPFFSTYDVWRLRHGQRLVRTCGGHEGHNAREGTWLTTDELELARDARATLERVQAEERAERKEEQAERKAKAEEPGVAQKAVLKAVADLDVLGVAIPSETVVAHAASLLPRSAAPTDQRKGVARRALRSLFDKGVLTSRQIWMSPARDNYQRCVLKVIDSLGPTASSLPMEELLDLCLGVMPLPEEGPDRRRQNLLRGMQDLAKGHMAPIALREGRVVFF